MADLSYVKVLKIKLARTDYVVTKLAECQFYTPEKLEEMKEKYKDVITERENIRNQIREIENAKHDKE